MYSALLVFTATWFAAQDPAPDYGKAGPHKVMTLTLEWKDAKRDGREVPVKIYCPEDGGPYPVLIVSHGLGGSRDGYAYLGQHWASHGFVSVHLQHRGSDDTVWMGSKDILAALKKAAADPANAVSRIQDVPFALDQLAKLNQEDGRLRGKLDLDRVGMTGHSFGARTTLAVIGQVFTTKAGKEVTVLEPRIKAAVAMSPIGSPKDNLDKTFGGIKVPCLHLTGTLDASPIDPNVKPADRRLPFDHIKLADQYLLIFQDGDHMVFSGRGKTPEAKDAVIQAHVQRCSTAFWQAYLKGDAKAKAYLRDGALQKALGKDGAYEFKAASQ